jgi:antirestriction protein ArdC
MLEKGGNVFRERWTRAASRGMPRNGKSGQPYHGANVLLLWDAAIEQGYASNVWLTYKQAASLGAQVRKGERAVLCAHFERKARDDASGNAGEPSPSRASDPEDEAADESQRGSFLLCRPFWLFNVAQIDGLPGETIDQHCYPPSAPHAPVEMAMRILAGSNAQIRHGFEQAMYVPHLDEIRLPWPRRFTSAQAHFATALHELVHDAGSRVMPNSLAKAPWQGLPSDRHHHSPRRNASSWSSGRYRPVSTGDIATRARARSLSRRSAWM